MTIHRTNTILYCNRWDDAVKFYRDGVKLRVLLQKAWFVEFELTGDSCLSVADAAPTSVGSAGGDGITLSWQVADIAAEHARMLAGGIEVSPITVTWGARNFFVFDPEGNRIEFWAWTNSQTPPSTPAI
jgi:catechol 2,3-dioxygenase-like lactoylglutathione lyase family enzyme